jgi:hypothetical protein
MQLISASECGAEPVTVTTMLEQGPGQFDPLLLQAFQNCADDFARINRDVRD